MNTSQFSLEFELNVNEIQRLNKMYFKRLYKERVAVFFAALFILISFLDFICLDSDQDLTNWQLLNLVLIVSFFLFHYSVVNTTCNLIFNLTKKLAAYTYFPAKYKLNFTSSYIYVNSPLGDIAHKWSQIEKAILTKEFFFLYIKDKEKHIISISNKCADSRNMDELIAFVESNVTKIKKI